jgi:hypothetical protein
MNLIDLLRSETRQLLSEYLDKTREYCEDYKNFVLRFKDYDAEQWCQFFGWTPHIANKGRLQEHITIPPSAYHTKEYNKKKRYEEDYYKMWVSKDGYEKFVNARLKRANMHYESSLKKLVERLKKKGIPEDVAPTVTHADIGINLNMTLTFKDVVGTTKTVNCYTIVAEGPIQQAHYRFLVK